MYGWQQHLKYKIADYRSKMRGVKYEKKISCEKNPAKNCKRLKRAEVNYLPPHPSGETSSSLEMERQELLGKVKKNNTKVIQEQIAKTFFCRRLEVVSADADDFKERWRSLFCEAEIKEEFRRITTLSLEQSFMYKL
ncbi:hypothetical protein LDENG_00299090, partial [Lucifuga dentata]